MISNQRISALFEATVQATEEAIINALVAAETMTGADGRSVQAISHDRVARRAPKVQSTALIGSTRVFRSSAPSESEAWQAVGVGPHDKRKKCR